MINVMKKPTIKEITDFCKERGNNIDAEHFFYHYESKGWLIGKSPMKSWQACVRTWERNTTHSMAIKGRDEAVRRSKEVYSKPLPKPKANPRIAELNKESFALTKSLRHMTAGARIAARAKIRDIGKQIQMIRDEASKVGGG